MYQYRATVFRIVDGDTVDVDVDLGFNIWMHQQRVRLSNYDAPETRTKDLDEKRRGIAAKEFLETLLPVGSEVILDSREFKDERGKYGRIIGNFFTVEGVSVRDMMIRAGHEK